MTASRQLPFSLYRVVAVVVLIAGVATSVWLYRGGRKHELQHAEDEFDRRVSLYHALTRESLGHHEHALYGLSAIIRSDGSVSPADFTHATNHLHAHMEGAQTCEWVPMVPHRERVAFEAELGQTYAPRVFELTEAGPGGKPRRAAERPFYFPITYIQPLAGNEAALGLDLMNGPTWPVLEQARSSREMMVTPQFRLVQEPGEKFGVALAWPVFRPGNPNSSPGETPSTDDAFAGFLQCVFRVHGLLEAIYSSQPDSILDMYFLDMSEPDPARRTLYYKPAHGIAATGAVSEADFRSGLYREFKIPFGHRDWRVLFRPRAGWMESLHSSNPTTRSIMVLLLAGLMAGLAEMGGRRSGTVKRKVAERTAELAESRRQMANMLHALPGMSFRCAYDDKLTVLFVSEGALALSGWSAEDFAAGRVHFRDCIHPDDLARVREATRSALQERRDFEVEYRICRKTGGERWVLSRGRGLHEAAGSPAILEGLAIDITAQKQAEAARLHLERKLLEGQKFESLGLLAGGLAHDFNNLLSAILGSASMARVSLAPGDPVEQPLRMIETASLRAAELCHQMLAYAGKGQFIIEPTSLSFVVEEMLPLLQGTLGRQAELNLDLGRDVPLVRADATQIRQIVINLVHNAGEATKERGGRIAIKTGVIFADRAMLMNCASGAGLAQGEYVFLEVSDDGAGMTPAVMEKMFDPFFTTKNSGRGLGLAAVQGIVRGHLGAIYVQSTPGHGSKFRILLPPAPKVSTSTRVPDALRARSRTKPVEVLMIEDEERVRSVTVEMLQLIGYAVSAVADGHAGVDMYRENPGRFDVVLLDLIMPGLSGEQTLATLRILNPDVRVLLLSGNGEGETIGRLGGSPMLGFIAKPFTRESLEKGIGALLG